MKIDKSPRPRTLAERKSSAEDTRRKLEPPAPSATQTPWRRRSQWLRNHPLVVILETAGLAGLIFAVGFFFYELRERQDERVARSWQLLTTPAPGNSGKREAIEYLNSQYGCLPIAKDSSGAPWWCWKARTSLEGIDLSSETHGGSVDLAGVNIAGASLFKANLAGANLADAVLTGADLRQANLFSAYLSGADLSDAILIGAKLPNAALYDAVLIDANLGDADLKSAGLRDANLTRAILVNANLSDTDLAEANLSGTNMALANFSGANMHFTQMNEANFSGTNLSGAFLFGAKLNEASFSLAWTFEDDPPHGVSDEIAKNFLYRKPDEHWAVFTERIMRERPELKLYDGIIRSIVAR